MVKISLNNRKAHDKLWKKATEFAHKSDWKSAANIYLELINIYPQNTDLLLQCSLCLSQIGKNIESFDIMRRLYELKPDDPVVLSNFAVICSKLSLLDQAELLLHTALNIDKNNLEYILNLVVVFNLKEKYNDALELLKIAIQIDPINSKSYTLLGSTFNKIGDNNAAKDSYKTAILIDPFNYEARLNVAAINSLEKNTELAIMQYEEILKTHTNNHLNSLPVEVVKYLLSFEYMKFGRLKEAFQYYELGFHQNIQNGSRGPKRRFSKPRWSGGDPKGKTILIWGEQGIGDELMFMSLVRGFSELNANLIIECEARLVTLLQRSFPKYKVRETSISNDIFLDSLYDDYDYHLPAGSLMGLFITKLIDFDNYGPYLLTNSELAEKYEGLISSVTSHSKRIGICWRSGNLNAERNINYTNLIDWNKVLRIPDCVFINLQYGECEDEIDEVESLFNIKILRFPELDLKNDFEATAALMTRLDVVLTVGTAVCQTAAALGLPVLLMAHREWTNFGTDGYPFYKNITCLFPPTGDMVAECLDEAAEIIKSL